MPIDQRGEDGNGLVYDAEPLTDRLEILGAPVVTLELAADRRCALVAVRLNDVAPDGASTRVSYGLLNLTHRDSHENPTALEPGRRYTVRVRLNDIAHAFPPGHRIRVAVTNQYFPLALTSPEPTTLTVYPPGALELPVRPPRAEDARLPPFGPPLTAKGLPATEHEPAGRWRAVEHDLATGTTTLRVRRSRGRYRLHDIDLTYGSGCRHRFSIRAGDPTSLRQSSAWRISFERGDWRIRIATELALAVTRENLLVAATLEAFEGDRRVFSRVWDKTIARDLG
jgi:hypothetical protein